MNLSVFTIGGGDLIKQVFDAIAAMFNDKACMGAITSLAIMIGGLFATFEFSKSRDIKVLIRWTGMYVIVTSLMLYPKATVNIEDRTGIDLKPRIVDHVPLSLAIFASITSRIGIGFAEAVEAVFHLPNDMAYNKTGMLMGSKLVLASRHFQITDPEFSQTLNEFMQQCVFYDVLLHKYTMRDLLRVDNPWEFIKTHTSQARAFPLNGEITVCSVGAGKLDAIWKQTIKDAATVYGGQLLGGNNRGGALLLSLSSGYQFLTDVSKQGEEILKTNLLANALDQALSHYGASANAPAAMQAYEDTKTELQSRETMDQTGRQAGIWMQHFKNIIEAVLYASFIFIYFLSYLPFGVVIIRNYLCGLFVLQALAPMYAIINFAANFFAQSRSMAFLGSDSTHGGLSMANIAGITQANADAIAVAGYLMWPVTLGGAVMLFRGMPSAIQSMGQLMGGVVQHAGSHVVAESVGGNISTGNANFGNRSMHNTNANHWDTNLRYAAGGQTFQTGTGSSLSITPDGNEVLDNRGAISNLSAHINWSETQRQVRSSQAQSSLSAARNNSIAESEQYSAALRHVNDYAHQQSQSQSSGTSHNSTETSGLTQSAHKVAQLMESWDKAHNVGHERNAQLFGQIYADIKTEANLFGQKIGVGANASVSAAARSSFGSHYNEARRYAEDHNFVEAVDYVKRASKEGHFRDSSDQSDRLAKSIATSFDKGDSYRKEVSSQLTKAESYSKMASESNEMAGSVSMNYTQEFYQWMRHQPSPSAQYGRGTFSSSAIDDMAVNDPVELQNHANRYLEEKLEKSSHAFNQAHHLTNGNQHIHDTFNHHHQDMAGHEGIERRFDSDNRHLKSSLQKIGYHPSQGVDDKIRSDVLKQFNHDQAALDKNHTELNTKSDPLKQQINEKVKGQVLGSLNGPIKGSTMEQITKKILPADRVKEVQDE